MTGKPLLIETISETLYHIPKTNLIIKIETNRGYRTSKKTRKEKTYISTYTPKLKYENSEPLRNISLGSSDYLVFEINETTSSERTRFMISYPNWFKMVNTFKQVRLLLQKRFDAIFFKQENQYGVSSEYQNDFELNNNTQSDNGYLFLRFDIKTNINNIAEEPCIVIIIDGVAEFISTNDFIELAYHIESLNLKQLTSQMHIRALLEYQYQTELDLLNPVAKSSSSVNKPPARKINKN